MLTYCVTAEAELTAVILIMDIPFLPSGISTKDSIMYSLLYRFSKYGMESSFLVSHRFFVMVIFTTVSPDTAG